MEQIRRLVKSLFPDRLKFPLGPGVAIRVKITEEAVQAFGNAWTERDGSENVINCSEHDMGDCPYHNTPGARRRAGLGAALTVLGFEVEE